MTRRSNKDHPAYKDGRQAAMEGNALRRALMAHGLKYAESDKQERYIRVWLAGYDAAAKEPLTK